MIVFLVLLTAVCGYAFYKTVWVKLSDDDLETNEPEVISEKPEFPVETVPVVVEAPATPVAAEKETVKKPKTRKPSAKKAPSKTNKPVKKRTPRRRDL